MGEPSDKPSLLDRINSWAKAHASNRSARQRSILPLTKPSNADGNPSNAPSRSTTTTLLQSQSNDAHSTSSSRAEKHNVVDDTSAAPPPPAPPPAGAQAEGAQSSPIENEKAADENPSIPTRIKNGVIRFVQHTKDTVTYSWVNILLFFVPIGIAVKFAAPNNPSLIFAMNAIAIIPLAGLLSHATESVASRLGDTLGALLNVSFGNAVELIIFIALVKDEITVVQASLLGSILANLLLILGMAFLLGGLRFREQVYNNTVTQMSACMLSLSVMSLLLPTAFHAAFKDTAQADSRTLKISRGTSVVLLLVYVLYLLFQLKSHAYLYESTPQHIIDLESHPGVLAEMLNSSSSSSSSDTSSDSDSDGSTNSRSTANRIKRAFRHRKRRKSSASSKDTQSIPSAMSSPSNETRPSFLDNNRSNAGGPAGPPEPRSRRESVLGAILSGDEADEEADNSRHDAPRVRDFQNERGQLSQSPERIKDKKCKKRSKRRHTENKDNKDSKNHKDHKNHDDQRDKNDQRDRVEPKEQEDVPAEDMIDVGPAALPVSDISQPQVNFADDVQIADASEANLKRSFNLRQLSLRPTLPQSVLNSVFFAPPPSPTTSPVVRAPMAPRVSHAKLRRTRSLPDRLNQTYRMDAIQKQLSGQSPAAQGVGVAIHSDEEEPQEPEMSRTAAVMLLLASTALVAVCAEFMVDAIPQMNSSGVSQAFISLIILPIVGNAAEHVTAVTVAAKNKMDLAIGVAVGSSIQIAIFVTPLVVILGWIMNKDMSLYFNIFETVSLFVTAFVVNFLVLDGRSNYLEGALLMAAYAIIAVCAFFYPSSDSQSQLGGSQQSNGTSRLMFL